MPTYIVNWRVRGLKRIKVLLPGQTIVLSAADAARFVAKGVLSLCAGGEASAPLTVPVGGAPGPQVDLSAMTKAQLVEYGRTRLGLSLDSAKTKSDLLAAIADAAGK